MNRQVVSRLSQLHLAPTESAKQNLLKEGFPEAQILVVGNTVIDALLQVVESIKKSPGTPGSIQEGLFISEFPKEDDSCHHSSSRKLWKRSYQYLPSHCQSGPNPPGRPICNSGGLFNPQVKKTVYKFLDSVKNVHLIEPQDYIAFAYLMMKSHLILTDSGGIQEEAPALGKPVLVLRETTERPEAVKAHCAVLVGTSQKKIVESLEKLLDDSSFYKKMSQAQSPFGDGTASQQIVKHFKKLAAARQRPGKP